MKPLQQQGQAVQQFIIAHPQAQIVRLHSNTVLQHGHELLAFHERIQAESVGLTNEVVPHHELEFGHLHDRRANSDTFELEAVIKHPKSDATANAGPPLSLTPI